MQKVISSKISSKSDDDLIFFLKKYIYIFIFIKKKID